MKDEPAEDEFRDDENEEEAANDLSDVQGIQVTEQIVDSNEDDDQQEMMEDSIVETHQVCNLVINITRLPPFCFVLC